MKLYRFITRTFMNYTASIKRFPLAMLCSLLAAYNLARSLNFRDVDLANINNNRLGAFFIGGIFLYSVISLYLESAKSNVKNAEDNKQIKFITVLVYILSIPIMYGFYDIIYITKQGFFPYESKYIYFGMIALFVVLASYIAKIFYHKDYVSYVANIFEAFIISNIYSIVSYIGISAIILAINSLFSANFPSNIYLKIFYFIFIPYNVGIFLSEFPKASESFIDYDYPKSIKVLLVYVILPLVLAYTAILFLYFLKIIINWQLPDGIIVNLVLWFAVVTVFFQFFLQKINKKFVNKFKKYYPFAIIPLLCMMFLSIGLRINQYGLTENRYFIVATGVWVLISEIYYIIYKKNSNITIPFILSIIILISSLGPISCYKMSEKSQIARLTKILEKNNMLKSNSIVKNKDISEDDKAQITSILLYLTNNHLKPDIPYLDEDFEFSDQKMLNTFGFKGQDETNYEGYYYYYDNPSSVDVSGYSKLIRNVVYNKDTKVDNFTFIYNPSTIEIYLTRKDKKDLLREIDLKSLRDKLKTLKTANGVINPEDLAISGENAGVKYKIIFTSISFNGEESKFDSYVSFDLLTSGSDE